MESSIKVWRIPRKPLFIIFKVGLIFTLCFLLGVLTLEIESVEAQSNWVNTSNITGFVRINDIEVNSVNDSLFILYGAHIEEWGLEEPVKQSTIWPGFTSFGDMDWNNERRWLAIENNQPTGGDEDSFNSPLAVINTNGTLLFAFEPWGDLPSYNSAEIVDLEWRPFTSHLAILFQDGMFRVYDIGDQSLFTFTQFAWSGKKIMWSPSGRYVFILTEDYRGWNEVFLYDLEKNDSESIYKSPITVHDIGWSYDSNIIFILLSSGLYKIPIETMNLVFYFETYANFFSPSPAGPLISLIEVKRGVSFWNYQLNTSEFHSINQGLTERSGWTQDGSYFFTEEEGTLVIRVWTKKSDLPKSTIRITFPNPEENISGNIIISGWAKSSYPNISFVLVKVGGDEWVPAEGFDNWYFLLNTSKYPIGVLNIRAKAIDPIGSSKVSKIIVYITQEHQQPNMPPIIWIDKPTDDEIVTNSIAIYGGALDDNSIIAIHIRVGIEAWRNVPIEPGANKIVWKDFIDVSNRMNNVTIYVRAFDGSVFSDNSSVNVRIKNTSIFPFIISILYPAQGSTVRPDFTAMGIVEGSTPNSIYISLDDGPFYIADGIWTWRYSFFNISYGQHRLKVVAMNDSRSSQMDFISFFIEDYKINQPPQIGILHPQYQMVVQSGLSVEGWSSDDRGVVKIEISINNNDWILVNGTNVWYFYIDDNHLKQGWNVIQARAFDGELHSSINSTQCYYLPSVNQTSDPYILYNSVLFIFIIVVSILSAYIISNRKLLFRE